MLRRRPRATCPCCSPIRRISRLATSSFPLSERMIEPPRWCRCGERREPATSRSPPYTLGQGEARQGVAIAAMQHSDGSGRMIRAVRLLLTLRMLRSTNTCPLDNSATLSAFGRSPLLLYPFRHRDPRTGKWARARYVAELHKIAERYSEWEITGPAEIRSGPGVALVSPSSMLAPRDHLPIEEPPEEPPPEKPPDDVPPVEEPPPIEDATRRQDLLRIALPTARRIASRERCWTWC